MAADAPARRTDPLEKTPLHGLHIELGAKMVPFAGYDMPVSYPAGILKEHLHTRAHAGLFDVSHMGQALVRGADHAACARALEALMPVNLLELAPGAMRYGFLLNGAGGIIDDLIVTRPVDADGILALVVNADRKAVDYRHLRDALPKGVELEELPDRALLALQGPGAVDALVPHLPGADTLGFMEAMAGALNGVACQVSRAGYTGEDGFEISLPAGAAEDAARALLADRAVQPIGLGARDSLRLEAGLCLYGHDIDETTSPVEAGLAWAIGKRRRREGGFPGFERIGRELAKGPDRLRVGVAPEGRAPVREGSAILDQAGEALGAVTSGGYAPTLERPIAMGYVTVTSAETGTPLQLQARGKRLPAAVTALPFVAHRYVRRKAA